MDTNSRLSNSKPRGMNPFTPIFGKIPSYLAGRREIIEDMLGAFDVGVNDPSLSSIFVGARGTGKTALLSYLAAEATKRGWIAANVTASPGMLDDILQRVEAAGSHLLESKLYRKLTRVDVSPFGGLAWGNQPSEQLNWRSKMSILLDQLQQTDTGIVITVDEVNPNLDEMVQLVLTYQHFIREDRKVALLMAGLPHNVSGLISGESTSFLRRASRYDLGSIPPDDIEEAFLITLESSGKTIEAAALEEAISATDGFPFMFQLVGYRMWNASGERNTITEDDVAQGVRMARKEFKRQILDSTYNELSNGDIDFLCAMLLDENDSALSDLSQRLNKPSGYVSTYKRRLLESGVIEETLRKRLRFNLPGFREYLASMENCDAG